MLVNPGREAGKFATCWCSAERTSLVVGAWVGSSVGLRGNRRSAGQTSLVSCLGRTRAGRPESRGALLRGAASSGRSPRLSSKCHLRGDQQEAPSVSLLLQVAAGGGRRPTPLRCHPRKDRGVDSMGSHARLQNVGEIRARLQNGKVHEPNDAICEVTGWRHRVSPCRSAYIKLVLGD